MNNNISENKNKYKNNCRKVYADYHRDDQDMPIWIPWKDLESWI